MSLYQAGAKVVFKKGGTYLADVKFDTRYNLMADGVVGEFTLAAISLALDVIKTIIPTKPAGPYTRMFALIYAATFYNRVCSDGKLVTHSGFPRVINKVTLAPGMPFTDLGVSPAVRQVDGELDCTHFISCCIGRPPAISINGLPPIAGGGLSINQPNSGNGAYGQAYAPWLVDELKQKKYATVVGPAFVPNHYADTRKMIKDELRPGDLLAYAAKNGGGYEHIAMLVGPDNITCHTKYRYGEDFTDVPFAWITLLRMPS